jgi:hypothetical protein
MGFRRFLAWSVTAHCVLAAATLAAQSSPPPDDRGAWLLGVGAQFDEEGGESLIGTFNVGVASSTWLTLVGGRSTSPAERADIEADTFVIGVDHRFAKVGFALEAEQWGDPGVLETEDLAGSVYFDRERWRVGFGYEARDIEIPLTLTGPLGGTLTRTVDVADDRYSLDARVGLGERWQLYLGAAEHDYERDLGVLPRIDRLNLLSASTLTLANSFIDHERFIGAEHDFGLTFVNFRYATDRSALDDSEFETYEVAVLLPIGRRVDLEVNVGHGRSEIFDAGLFGGLVFLIYGR